jgi:hypothetical protein
MEEDKTWKEIIPVSIRSTIDYMNYGGFDMHTEYRHIDNLVNELVDLDSDLQDYVIDHINRVEIRREVAEELARVSWTLKLLDINGRV